MAQVRLDARDASGQMYHNYDRHRKSCHMSRHSLYVTADANRGGGDEIIQVVLGPTSTLLQHIAQ